MMDKHISLSTYHSASPKCYRVQACIAHRTTGQYIERQIVGARNSDFIHKANRLRRWWTSVKDPYCLGLDSSVFYRTKMQK